ncbi:MAG: hypothetical protein QXX95_07375 [Nitrososphaerales archaeon]
MKVYESHNGIIVSNIFSLVKENPPLPVKKSKKGKKSVHGIIWYAYVFMVYSI